MAEVTESSLNLAAHEIVAAFNNDGVTLNDGVIKKAIELGLNRDQTARLIERTNSEAFLSLFPEKTDFVVADPNVILKTASVNVEPVAKVAGVEKTASAHRSSYADSLERDAYEIFGVDMAHEKMASDCMLKTAKDLFSERIEASTVLDNIGIEKAARLIEMEGASNSLWSVFKEEALSGRSTADMEREVVLAFPEKTASVCAVFENMMDKLASATLLPVDSFERLQVEDINTNEVVMSSRLTEAFKGVLDYDKN